MLKPVIHDIRFPNDQPEHFDFKISMKSKYCLLYVILSLNSTIKFSVTDGATTDHPTPSQKVTWGQMHAHKIPYKKQVFDQFWR